MTSPPHAVRRRHFLPQLLGAILGSLACGTPAGADGWHLSDREVHLREPRQKAVVVWDGRTETMVLSSAVAAEELANFSWVVPINSKVKPEVVAGDIAAFKDLMDWFFPPPPPPQWSFSGGSSARARVVESKEIEVYDVTILEAAQAAALTDWLAGNGYRVPAGARPVLEGYIRHGFRYFAVNRLDLRNKYEKEIAEVERIYGEAERTYQALAADINTELARLGIKGRVSSDSSYWLAREIEGVLQDAVDSYENPLGLATLSTTDLGGGITAVERLAAPRIRLEFHWDPDHVQRLRALLPDRSPWPGPIVFVLRGGELLCALNHRTHSRHRESEITTDPVVGGGFSDSGRLSPREAELVGAYWASRPMVPASPDASAEAQRKATALCEELNRALGRKMGDHARLNAELYYYASAYFGDYTAQDRPVTLAVKIDAVFYGTYLNSAFGGGGQSFFRDLYAAKNDLLTGIGTPLRFSFQPKEPYYPLTISSLNAGDTFVEVYVLQNRGPVRDDNAILHQDESKPIGDELKAKLEKSLGVPVFEQATRLSFKGPSQALCADAVFR